LQDLPEGDDLRVDEALQRADVVAALQQLLLVPGEALPPLHRHAFPSRHGAAHDEAVDLVREVACDAAVSNQCPTWTAGPARDGDGKDEERKRTYVAAARSRRPCS